MLWRVREGMQGLLAAIRPPGVQLIIEDVCVPPARVAEARQGPAGAARQARLPARGWPATRPPATCTSCSPRTSASRADLDRYDAFMHELVELIVDKYDGSLKAEHGTGINMAPFVEREWGSKATEMMWRIKQLADPDGILAPGRGAQPRSRRPPAQPQVDAGDRGRRDQVHRVRVLRAGVPVAQRDDDAAPADRDAPRDGPPAGAARRCSRAARAAVRVRRHRDVRGRRIVHATRVRSRSTRAS